MSSNPHLELGDGELVVMERPATRVHFRVDGRAANYKMKSDLVLTTERLVGVRKFFRQHQITPDVALERISSIEVVKTLRMPGLSRTNARSVFVRMEVAEPDGILALAMLPDEADAWATALTAKR